MANGMMAPEGMMEAMPAEEPMMDRDMAIQQAADQGTLQVGGVTKSSTEGGPTNFVVTGDQFVSTLDDEIIQILETKLTPSMRYALGTILGPEVATILDQIGLQEPQHLVPHSAIANAFPAETIEKSIAMFDNVVTGGSAPQQNIPTPPTGGLGGAPMEDPMAAPQTNVPPVV